MLSTVGSPGAGEEEREGEAGKEVGRDAKEGTAEGGRRDGRRGIEGKDRDDVIVAMAMYALHCSVAQRSWLIPLSLSAKSDESGKQFLYSDGDRDHRQSLIVCSLAHCQPSLKFSCKSVRKFLCNVANKQTDKQTDRQTTTKTYPPWRR